MLKTNYDFDQAILPAGNSLKTSILLYFRVNLPESSRRNLNLSLVIDRSGSMAGPPLHRGCGAK